MNKERRKISIFICLMLVSCLLFLTSCRTSTNHEETRIVFWHNYTGDKATVFNMLVETYNTTEGKTRNVRVIPEYKAIHDITQSLSERFDDCDCEYPEISVITNEFAYKSMCRSLIANAEDYMTSDELGGYVSDFLNAGRFTEKSGIYVFPITKTSDVTIANESLWRSFYSESDIHESQWETWSGISDMAEKYYHWSGGKAFIAFESAQNLIFTYAYQQLPPIIQAGNREIKINTNKSTLRALWDFYYCGVVRGYISQAEDIPAALENGTILCYEGLPRSSSYYPTKYRNIDGSRSILDISVRKYPSVNTSRGVAPQNGYGVSVFDHGVKTNQESYRFLHWFNTNEKVIQFSAQECETPSYSKNYNETQTKNYMKNLSMIDNVKYNMITVTSEQSLNGITYAPTGFVGCESFCSELTDFLVTSARKARSYVIDMTSKGTPYETAVAKVNTEAAFNEWYQYVVLLAARY